MDIDFRDSGFLFHFLLGLFGLSLAVSTIARDYHNWATIFTILAGFTVAVVSGYMIFKGNYREMDSPKWASYLMLIGALMMLISTLVILSTMP